MLTLRKLQKIKFEERIISIIDEDTGRKYCLKALKNSKIFPYEILVPVDFVVKVAKIGGRKRIELLNFSHRKIIDVDNISTIQSSDAGIKILKLIAANATKVFLFFDKDGSICNVGYHYDRKSYLEDIDYFDSYITLIDSDYVNEEFLLKERY